MNKQDTYILKSTNKKMAKLSFFNFKNTKLLNVGQRYKQPFCLWAGNDSREMSQKNWTGLQTAKKPNKNKHSLQHCNAKPLVCDAIT